MANVFSFECAPLSSAVLAVGFVGEEAISSLYRFEVWLAVPDDEAASLSLDALIGLDGTLRIVDETGAPRRTVHGMVIEAAWDEGSLARVVIAPRLWVSTLDRHSKVWVDRPLRTVLKDALEGAGLSEGSTFVLRLNQRPTPLEHVCQYRESHVDFARRWMEQAGVPFWFEHDGGQEKLVATDTPGDHPTCPSATVRYFASAEEDRSIPEALWSFTQRRSAASLEARVRDYNPRSPTLAIDRTGAGDDRSVGQRVWHLEDDAATPSDAQRSAKLRGEEHRTARERFFGAGRVFGLMPGGFFELEEHPRGALNQKYLCVALRHRGNALAVGDGSPELRARIGTDVYRVEVEAIRGDVPFRPARLTPMPRVEGFEVGFVDGPADSDYAQIDDRGRYRVRLHLDERANPAGLASTWVRMLQPHGGSPEGWHFPLRKGTEVLVSFLGGDPDRPVISGAVPDRDHPSPVTSANHTQNVLHTGGDNRWELEDLAGAQYIDISTPPQNTFLHLGAHHGSHQHNAIASTDGNGLVHQGANQDITVGGHKTEDVQRAVKEKYDSTHTVTVKQDVTEIFHATQTTVVDAHNGETYGTHTTEVTGHKVETCTSQSTTVAGLLDEHHGTQDTTVDGLLKTTCATRTMKVAGQSAQLYDSLTVNVGAGGWTVNDSSYLFFDAPNYTVLVPEVTETEVLRTEMTQASWYTIKSVKDSKDQVKLSLIAGAVSVIATIKFDTIGVAMGYSAQKAGFYAYKRDTAVLKFEAAPTKTKLTGVTAVIAGLKAWL